MLKTGLAALLIGLLLYGANLPTLGAPQPACASIASACSCCSPHCPVKDGDSCVSCVREKSGQAVVTTQPVAKPRISVPLYLLAENKPADGRPLFAQFSHGLNPSPPSGGPPHQALLRLWLI